MKSFIYFFLFFLLFFYITNLQAQVTGKYHRVYQVLPQYCETGITTNTDLKLVINIEDKLEVGTVFEYNFGSGSKFWTVIYSQDGSGSDEDLTIDGSNIVPIDYCPNSYRYHRLQYLGSSLTELENNYCDRIQTTQYQIKVDIKISQKLAIGHVYYISQNVYSYPSGYYYVKYSGFHDSSDEDAIIDNSSVISSYNLSDSDNDGIFDYCDNCPNTPNANQTDTDGDGLGNDCDNDIDGDGIINSNDDCPTVFGLGSNNGCPDSDGDGIPDNQDDCPNEAGAASNNGCPLGDPDFIITQISVEADDNTFSSTPNSLILEPNQYHEFCFTIKNQGESDGDVDSIEPILANSNNLLNANKVASLAVLNINENLEPNETIEVCYEVFLANPYLGNSLTSYTYLHALLNSNDNEENTTNNDIYCLVNTTSARNYPKTIINLNTFSRTIVINEDEEKTTMSNLINGLYVIKDNIGNNIKMIKH
ncbi:thrombospondin type 3 repeat-containing protein [Winogradskyella sp. ECml5-4]|uniref:thrombospondin type 3 repeat-containing protein n=1 Tax=Winogradskyella sp. ECml5-4 TaxID=3110975 RepID=UPI002FF281AA